MALFLERVGLDSGRLDGNARVTKTYNTRPDSFFKGSRGCGEPRLAKRPRPRGDPGDLEAVATITSTNSLASHPSASLLLPDLRPYNIDILGSVHNGPSLFVFLLVRFLRSKSLFKASTSRLLPAVSISHRYSQRNHNDHDSNSISND